VPRLKRPSNLDLLIAVGLAVWALVEAVALQRPGSTIERVAWALAFTVPLAWRQQYPLAVAIGLTAIVVLRVVTSQHGTQEEGAMPFPALLLATYSVAANSRELVRAAIGGLVIYGGIAVAVFLNYYTGTAQPSMRRSSRSSCSRRGGRASWFVAAPSAPAPRRTPPWQPNVLGSRASCTTSSATACR
jgi:hypothetical protein